MMIMHLRKQRRRIPINVRLPNSQVKEIDRLRKTRNKNRTDQIEEVIDTGLKYFREG